MNPDSAQAVAVIDAEKAAETPIFHQVEGMAQQVAGVGQGSTPVTRGGLSRYGHFYIDGLDTTDISVGSITAPMNFDAVQNFEIITGGTDAQYNSMGVVTNAVTKSGSNRFTWDVNFTFEPAFLAAQNQYPTNTPPGFGLYQFPVTQAPETSFYSPVVNFGGPIVPDKLWFYASYQQNFSDKNVPISQLGQQYNRPTDTTTTLGRVKFTWQATSNDKLSLGLNLDRNVINNDVGTSYVTNDAELKIYRGGEFVLLNYYYNFTDSVLFQLQTGFTFEQTNTDPIYSDFLTPNHYDIDTGIDSQNADAISFGTCRATSSTRPSGTCSSTPPSPGPRTRSAPTSSRRGSRSPIRSINRSPASREMNGIPIAAASAIRTTRRTFAACYQLTTFYNSDNQLAPLTSNANALKAGVFIQDKWNVNRRLTILPGIRADLGFLYGTTSNLLATLAALGPRLGFTYDLLGDHKYLLVGHYGRSNDTGDVFIAQHLNPQLQQWTSTFNSTPTPSPPARARRRWPRSAPPGRRPAAPTAAAATITCRPTAPRCSTTSARLLIWMSSPAASTPSSSPTPSSAYDYTYRYYGDM